MTASAFFLGIIGVGLTFMPLEIGGYLSTDISQISVLTLQLLGAVYVGFAMLNWMTRNNPIGGIYGKPLLIGNLVHFLVSSLALIKIVGSVKNHFEIMLAFTIIYSLFTLGFIFAFRTNPKQK